MRFITTFQNSLWNLSWLKNHARDAKHAWGYFFLLNVFVILISFIPVFVGLPKMVATVRERVHALPDFSAEMDKGSLSVSGLKQPYVVRENGYVFVVDTNSTSTPVLKTYVEADQRGGLLVARSGLTVLNQDTGAEESQTWDASLSFKQSRDGLVSQIERFTQFQYVALFVVVMFVVSVVFAVINKLVVLVLVVSFVSLITLFSARRWSWSSLLVVGLFGATLPSLIELVFAQLGLSFTGLFFVTLLAFMLAAVFTKDEESKAVDFFNGSDSL